MRASSVTRGSAWIIVALFFARIHIAPAASFNVLYNFGAFPGDGVTPVGGLLDVGGTLYGMAGGGADSDGAIVTFNTAAGTESVDYSFAGSPTDGADPSGELIQSSTDPSTLYGMTGEGGSVGHGTLFSFDTSTDTDSLLHSFATSEGAADGNSPNGSVIQSAATLYGMAMNVIFSYDVSDGVEAPLYSFGGRPDGDLPHGSLIQVGSVLYGTCSSGGAYGGVINPSGQIGGGTVFSYNLDTGQETVLHSFAGGPGDGSAPDSTLVQSGSILYGTAFGGADDAGIIFSYNIATGSYQVLFSFDGNDGNVDAGNLVVDGTMLYGVGAGGGGDGCVYAYNTLTGTESILHTFEGTDGGPGNDDSLALYGNTLYGMTEVGGTYNDGVIYSIVLPEPATFSILVATGACLLLRRRRLRSR